MLKVGRDKSCIGIRRYHFRRKILGNAGIILRTLLLRPPVSRLCLGGNAQEAFSDEQPWHFLEICSSYIRKVLRERKIPTVYWSTWRNFFRITRSSSLVENFSVYATCSVQPLKNDVQMPYKCINSAIQSGNNVHFEKLKCRKIKWKSKTMIYTFKWTQINHPITNTIVCHEHNTYHN